VNNINIFLSFNGILFVLSLAGIVSVFLFTPIAALTILLLRNRKVAVYSPINPSVSLIVTVHNAEDLISRKIANCLSINYPSDNFEIIVFSDGSTDKTGENINSVINEKVRFYFSSSHEGKNNAINEAVRHSKGEILVFSDVDSILEPDSIVNLVKHFADPNTGGVSGRNIFHYDDSKLIDAQRDYIKFDDMIKRLESRVGSIHTKTGTLSAVRRKLFQPLPLAVADDMYMPLLIVRQNHRFIFEPSARVYVKPLSKNPAHEIQRRRRTVTRSLTAIYFMKELLSPFKYGMFAFNLFVNKVCRRFIPFFLIILFLSSFSLSFYFPLIRIVFVLQVAFYFLALSYWILFQHIRRIKVLTKMTLSAFYFCIGVYGTLVGLIDFFTGREYITWETQH